MAPIHQIDHRFYPHVIDLIISFLAYSSLLTFRATARSYHDKIDKDLFRHIRIQAIDHTRCAVQQAFAPFSHLPLVPPSGFTPPGPKTTWSTEQNRLYTLADGSAQRKLRLTSAVDVIDWWRWNSCPDLEYCADQLQNVAIQRARHGTSRASFIKSRATAEWVDVSPPASDVVLVLDLPKNNQAPFVLHVLFNTAAASSKMYRRILIDGEDGDEVGAYTHFVVVFEPYCDPSDVPPPNDGRGDQEMAFLAFAFNHIALFLIGGTQVTFVGLEQVDPYILGFDCAPGTEAVARIKEAIMNKARNAIARLPRKHKKTREKALARVSFMTRAEWDAQPKTLLDERIP
jgi:hypothetical protein